MTASNDVCQGHRCRYQSLYIVKGGWFQSSNFEAPALNPQELGN